MQTAMLKRVIINVLLANQREVNKRKSEGSEQSIVSVQVQICYNIYYYTTGLQFMSLVQQSQNFKSVTVSFLLISLTDDDDYSGVANMAVLC